MDEKQQKLEQIKQVIEKLKTKDFNFYFFTLDTKGNPSAGIANIYEHVKLLNEFGYKAYIMHEKADYKLRGDENGMGIADWLGEEYASLPHIAIEGQNLNISPADFIVIPEIFSTIMDQIKTFPCRKIVMCQNYDYLLELLPIGKRWDIDYGFTHVITTTEKQSQYVRNLFPTVRTHVVPVSIPQYFSPNTKPKKPIIAILSRNQTDTVKIAKSFYLQYPIYKWITFKELRGLSRKTFADELKDCCLAVWVDDSSGFGTFPLEAMECNTPVIGKIPNLIPDWMETKDEHGNPAIKNNGVWTNTTLNIPELIATYMKIFFEDALPNDLLESMKESTGHYTAEQQKIVASNVYDILVQERIGEFNNILANERVEA
jgi:hypothetical protein